MILVTGGTGTSGRPIVQQLSLAGIPCRIIVRNPERAAPLKLPGVEHVPGDFNDPATLDRALQGVERALLNSTPDPAQIQMQSQFIKAARRAGVKHIVKFSVQGASPSAAFAYGRWHGVTEEELKASGIAWTMLQPTFFMQNTLGLAESIKTSDGFFMPAGDGNAAYVDVRDIAAVAVKALTDQGHESKSYTITGPADLSCHDIADAISRAVGRKVKYVDVPCDQAREAMRKGGMPEWRADATCELMNLLRDGKMSGVTNTVREVAGKEPIAFDDFAVENAAAFK